MVSASVRQLFVFKSHMVYKQNGIPCNSCDKLCPSIQAYILVCEYTLSLS